MHAQLLDDFQRLGAVIEGQARGHFFGALCAVYTECKPQCLCATVWRLSTGGLNPACCSREHATVSSYALGSLWLCCLLAALQRGFSRYSQRDVNSTGDLLSPNGRGALEGQIEDLERQESPSPSDQMGPFARTTRFGRGAVDSAHVVKTLYSSPSGRYGSELPPLSGSLPTMLSRVQTTSECPLSVLAVC
jgi:hypothetical protein